MNQLPEFDSGGNVVPVPMRYDVQLETLQDAKDGLQAIRQSLHDTRGLKSTRMREGMLYAVERYIKSAIDDVDVLLIEYEYLNWELERASNEKGEVV